MIHLVMQECSLIRKFDHNFKIYDVINWETIITILILANSSRSKDNQKMKFVCLIEYNLKYVSLKNHAQNLVEKFSS